VSRDRVPTLSELVAEQVEERIVCELGLLQADHVRAPLIQPTLFKTAFYWVIVFFARLLERLVHFSLEGNAPGDFLPYLVTTFSWQRFSAISLWILVLFLVYVTALEFSHLFGSGEMRRLLFTRRPSELQLNRRQRMRELLRLSRLVDAHSGDEFRDPRNTAHRELVEIWTDLPDSIETNRMKGSMLHSQRVTPRPGLALGDRSPGQAKAGNGRVFRSISSLRETSSPCSVATTLLETRCSDDYRWIREGGSRNPTRYYGPILLVRRVTRTKSLKALGAKVAL